MNIPSAFSNLKSLLFDKGELEESVIFEIMSAFRIHTKLKRNENLITPGEKEEHLYYVLNGTLRLYCMKGEEEICYNFGYPTTFISAYTSFLSGKPSESYIKAITDCELIGIHKKDFYALLDKIPQIERTWRIFTEEALLERMERELEMLMLSPEERFTKCMENAPHLFQLIPHFVFGVIGGVYYKKIFYNSLIFIYLFSGFWVWMGGRSSYHIGASGVVYGMAFFLFVLGTIHFKRDKIALQIAMFVAFFYGGMIWGMLPGLQEISWESHWFGAISGVIMAFYFRNDTPVPPQYEWEKYDDPNETGAWDYKRNFPPPQGLQYPKDKKGNQVAVQMLPRAVKQGRK